MGTILNIGDKVSTTGTVDILYADGTAKVKIGCWFLDRDSIYVNRIPEGTRPGDKLTIYGKVLAVATGPLNTYVKFGKLSTKCWMSSWSLTREDKED